MKSQLRRRKKINQLGYLESLKLCKVQTIQRLFLMIFLDLEDFINRGAIYKAQVSYLQRKDPEGHVELCGSRFHSGILENCQSKQRTLHLIR